MNSKAQIRPASALIPQGTIKESTAAPRAAPAERPVITE
jgi:hypothetical protein